MNGSLRRLIAGRLSVSTAVAAGLVVGLLLAPVRGSAFHNRPEQAESGAALDTRESIRAAAESKFLEIAHSDCIGSSDVTLVADDELDSLVADAPTSGWARPGLWVGQPEAAARALDASILVEGAAAVWIVGDRNGTLAATELLRLSPTTDTSVFVLADGIAVLDAAACNKE